MWVTVNGTSHEIDQGMTYEQLADRLSYGDVVMLAQEGNRLTELRGEVKDGAEITFLTTDSAAGYLTYKRSMNLLLFKAASDVLETEDKPEITILHSVGNAWYYEIRPEQIQITDEMVEKIEERMLDLVKQDLTIHKRSISTDEAIAYFKEKGCMDKVSLLKYRRSSKTNIYGLEGYWDYYYGYMVPSTGRLKHFKLQKEGNYLLLQIPKQGETEIQEPVHLPKLLRVLERSKQWSETMKVSTVGALNDVVTYGDIHQLILVQEALQENLISRIAQEIVDGKKKIILIAGPSSSGKTTFSHRLSIQLKIHGLQPHPIALDDFFRDRIYSPKDENGEYDFESILCLDIPLFDQCMRDLLDGKEVILPKYNFLTGKSEKYEKPMQIHENDVLIIEGIHGLNEDLSKNLPQDCKYKIYVSALTQLAIDDHNRIPTTDGRLIRRIIRDARTRGVDAQSTIARWKSVRAGEERNIFPYQEMADVMFNSAQVYELAVLKQYAEPLLFSVPRDSIEYQEAKRLLKFFDYFLTIKSEDIPRSSILREFIGGGCFHT